MRPSPAAELDHAPSLIDRLAELPDPRDPGASATPGFRSSPRAWSPPPEVVPPSPPSPRSAGTAAPGRGVCHAVHARGEYRLFVEDNQETRRADIGLLFAGGPAFPPYQQRLWAEDARAATRDKGHGRVEVRTLTTTT